jgi:hypothetical protein
MSGREHTPRQTLLITLHNVGAIVGKNGKTLEEITTLTNIKRNEVEDIIASQIESGYLTFSTDEAGTRHYQLTGRGIIRVSSLYT